MTETYSRRRCWTRTWTILALVALVGACGSDPEQSNGNGQGTSTADGSDSGPLDLSDAFGKNDASTTADAAVAGDAGTTADTAAAADTTAPDTTAPDTTAPDTTVTPDTTTSDTTADLDAGASGSCVGFCGKYQASSPCQCDSSCVNAGDCCADYEAICAADTTDSDVGSTDAAADTTGGGDVATADGSAPAGSCQGLCDKYVAGNACQCDSGCTQYGDCCGDYKALCAVASCAKDADCDDKLTCTTDACVAGACKHTAAANMCVIDGACYKDGDSDTNSCLVCKSSDSAEDWTVDLAATCDDGNGCTTGDVCEASGTCAGTKTANCCAKDVDCNDGNACSAGTCDLGNGTCSFKPKPGCCAAGVCCDLAVNAAKAKGTPCSTESQAVEYQCDGKQVQKREAYPGCDGSSVGTCGTDKATWSWTTWQTVQTCGADQTCKAQSGGAPVCEGGVNTGCKSASDCDDSNACTKDSCNAGKCSQQAIAGCCTFPSDCDDGNACTVDLCESNKCSSATTPCAATSDCEVAACDAKTGACKISVKGGWCKVGDQCAKDGASNPSNACQSCAAGTSPTDWSVSGACACSSGACCDVAKGTIKTAASKCDEAVKSNQYRCTKDGKNIEYRQAHLGCTGKSNTCSVSASNYFWTPWTKQKDCGAGTVCEVSSDTTPGICKSVVVQTCTPGTSCCTSAGAWAAQTTKCGTLTLATEYQCSSTQAGSDVQSRVSNPGCTGNSSTCSSAAANVSWSAWSTTKDCKSPSQCQVLDKTKPGVCTEITACKPGTTCCTDTGSWAAQQTKCGTNAVKTVYSCSSDKAGGSVMVTQSFGGCMGGAATCSYATANLHTAAPATYKKCGATQVCNVSDVSKPGVCTDPVDALCTKTDIYEAGKTIATSHYLGMFKDTDATKILNPKVHFNSESDRDYFNYRISDSGSAISAPTVRIEWSAPQKVRVCAYYQCEAGVGGKNCEQVKCPTGFTSGTSGTASGTIGNGCCLVTAAASGTLAWQPTLPSASTSLAGRVYFDVQNAAPICQEAAVKLVFGAKQATQCTPGSQCCTASGTFAPQKTKCGSAAAATEYQCSSSAAGGDVQSRQAWRGCTGASTTCSVSTSNYTWTAWATSKDCKTTETCVVTSASQPGVCKLLSDPLCTKTDKYESGTYYTSAYNLGSFDDSSAAMVLNPKVHFKNSSDNDYFVYSIADKLNLTDPRVQIEWSGAADVSVCAYYQCSKGTGGKDCKPTVCPAGSTASSRSAVSDAKPNGCCMTAKTGVLSFKPDAAGSTDETGKVYLRMFSAAPICQEVTTKLVFGSKTATQCTPNTTCCSASGAYSATATKCATTALETQYKCSSSAKGASVQVRKSYAGCTGSSTTCSTATANRSWSAWSTYKSCTSAEVCSVSSLNTAGVCKAAVNPICSKFDKYETGTSINSAYNVGAYKDSSAAVFLSPEIIFGTQYDYDYLKYHITDEFNLTDPRVQIEFKGTDKVRVCAYYQCEKGTGGKDCKPVSCPAGTTASSFFSVSSASPNGCCMEAAAGTLAFKPDAPNSNDETGWVYLRVSNASNVCQEVSAKLVFGSQAATVCNPNTTCCTASGSYATKATKCGSSALKTEYKCSSTANSGDVLVRKAYAGCAGSSTSCSTSSSNYSWSAWTTYKNCTSSEICSVTDPAIAGVCKTTGSSAPLCSAVDKYESGYSTTTAYNLGTFKDSAAATVLDPDVHFKTPYDSDYIRYSIEDAFNLNNPTVDVSWTAAESLEMCAWYRCNNGAGGKDCKDVACPSGTIKSKNSLVSGAAVNGCCQTGKTGNIKFTPDASGTNNETGWVYVRAVNKAPICQYVNTKVSFGGSTDACGDGKCTSGESTSCKQDCGGSCLGKCAAAYSSKNVCQCDAGCANAKDCCWDHNLYCAK